MKQVGIFLHKLHWLQLFQQGFLAHFISGFTAFFFKVAGVGDVAHIPHFISKVLQVAIQYIKGHIRAGMPKMAFAAHCGPAHIHAYIRRMYRGEYFFLAGV